jgi:hypothetical protein
MFKKHKRIVSYLNTTMTYDEVVAEVKSMRVYDPNKNYSITTTTGRDDSETNYFVGVEE